MKIRERSGIPLEVEDSSGISWREFKRGRKRRKRWDSDSGEGEPGYESS